MKNFGFKISASRQLDMDTIQSDLYEKLIQLEPTAKRCLMCGACAATCTAAEINGFNFRYCHLLMKRGILDNLAKELSKCMLCGKCYMVCPREINTRSIILKMKALMTETTPKHYSL